jgi:hypothetical protein
MHPTADRAGGPHCGHAQPGHPSLGPAQHIGQLKYTAVPRLAGGSLGIDPVLSVAPVLALAGAALLPLRILPAAARLSTARAPVAGASPPPWPLLTVVRSEGITALVATHDEALIDLADEVIRLEDGRVTS